MIRIWCLGEDPKAFRVRNFEVGESALAWLAVIGWKVDVKLCQQLEIILGEHQDETRALERSREELKKRE
jgi:hypothetical protein